MADRMTEDQTIVAAIQRAYPDSVKQHGADEPAFIRPGFGDDGPRYSEGFYYVNMDADRFYFDTFDEAALDLAQEIDLTLTEAEVIVAGGNPYG